MTIQEKFEIFHKNNPHVYKLILKYTKEAYEAGYNHYSINGIFERIRWHVDIEIKSDEKFKLSNNFRSRYVRLFESRNPNMIGFFATRELKAK
jgi:hypothetical protein